MSSQILLPQIMQIGSGASRHLVGVLHQLGLSAPLLITDPTMVELGYAEQIRKELTTHSISVSIFSNTEAEPTEASIIAAVEMVKLGRYDCLIGLGGGSPIDSAKAVSVLASFGGSMRDYKVPQLVSQRGLPVIAIPTTAGTGSEATRFTIITDAESDEKMLCAGPGLMPVAALVDYELTMSVPARTTADTGIDALTHAIESYVSQKANPYTDTQALTAMGLLAPNLRKVYIDGSDHKARSAMMLGSTLAGIAFSNASVALVHGMSRPLGAFFHVPHGLSNAMLLPIVTEFSIPAATKRYGECAVAMGVATVSDSDSRACDKLLAELSSLTRDLEVPTLGEFGVARSDFDTVVSTMAAQALASGSPANNPITPSADEIESLYRLMW